MDLKAAIEHQTELVFYLRVDMHFIKECKERAISKDMTIQMPFIPIIRQLALNDCFIKFYKLVHHKEQHSIGKLLNEAAKQGFRSVDGFKELKEMKVEIINLFKKNHLNSIRNEHIAHSDVNRDKYTYTWNDLFLLTQLLTDFYTKLKLIVTGHDTRFTDDDILTRVIEVTQQYIKSIRKNGDK